MEEVLSRFPHIGEGIFKELNGKDFLKSMEVNRSWKYFIDNQRVLKKSFKTHKALHQKIKAEIDDLKKKCRNGLTPFHLACGDGQEELADVIMKNSAKLNIDLNVKDNGGWTAFHYTCGNGHSKIAGMIMKNSAKFNIELNAKDNTGWTAFHFACRLGRISIVEMMINNSESLKLDLTARGIFGLTGFQWAQRNGHTDVVNLIRSKMPKIAI